MKIIQRYVLRETLWPFLFGFLFFNFILFIGIIFDLTELIFTENAPPFKVVQMIAFSLPSFFDIVIPVSLLFSILLSFGRLSADGEITALRSSGVNLFRIEAPVLLFAAILTLVSLGFSAFLTPWCNQRYKKIYQQILLSRPTVELEERAIVDLENKKLYTYKIDEKEQVMERIVVYEFYPPNSTFPQITLAEKGEVRNEKIYLHQVRLYRFSKNYRLIQSARFNEQTIYLYSRFEKIEEQKKDSWDMTFSEIRQKLKEEKMSPEERKKLESDFHGRIAIPLATFILGIMSVPLGIKVERGDKSISLGISLIVVIVYYIFFLAGSFFSQRGLVSPFLGVWMPNFILLSVGIWLNIKIFKR